MKVASESRLINLIVYISLLLQHIFLRHALVDNEQQFPQENPGQEIRPHSDVFWL